LHSGKTIRLTPEDTYFEFVLDFIYYKVEEWCLLDVTPCGSCKKDVSEELSASIRVTRIGVLGTTLAVTSKRISAKCISSQLASVASYS
jgi:hypothetical protein